MTDMNIYMFCLTHFKTDQPAIINTAPSFQPYNKLLILNITKETEATTLNIFQNISGKYNCSKNILIKLQPLDHN